MRGIGHSIGSDADIDFCIGSDTGICSVSVASAMLFRDVMSIHVIVIPWLCVVAHILLSIMILIQIMRVEYEFRLYVVYL